MFNYFLIFLQSFKSKSIIITILANLSVLIGVFVFDWRVGNIILLYFFESLISIYFNYKKIYNNQNPDIPKVIFNGRLVTSLEEIKKLLGRFSLEFYAIAYLIYLPLVFILFIPGLIDLNKDFKEIAYQILKVVMFCVVNLLFLYFSYFYEYKHNYIFKEENKTEYLGKLFGGPVKRTIVLHITIVLAAFGTRSADQTQIAIIVFVILKTIIDVLTYINLKNNLLKPFNKTIIFTKDGNSTSVYYE